MALGILAIIIRHPEMMQELQSGYDDNMSEQDAPALPTPLSKIEPPYAYRDHSLNYRKFVYFNFLYESEKYFDNYSEIFFFFFGRKMFQIMLIWAD